MTLVLPPIIGHRGVAGLAPENTLASFALAADLGCRMVEFDVRLTADTIPVVFHDDTLERRTGVVGRVGACRLDQLRGLDAGSGQLIPTLEEVLALCLARDLAVNIEIKPDRGAERTTALRALEVAGRVWPSDRALPLVSSFSDEALRGAAEAAPSWPRALLVDRVRADWRRRVDALGCVAVNPSCLGLTAARVREIKAAGLALASYTVNTPARAHRLWGWGVDAVFSDRPDRLS